MSVRIHFACRTSLPKDCEPCYILLQSEGVHKKKGGRTLRNMGDAEVR